MKQHDGATARTTECRGTSYLQTAAIIPAPTSATQPSPYSGALARWCVARVRLLQISFNQAPPQSHKPPPQTSPHKSHTSSPSSAPHPHTAYASSPPHTYCPLHSHRPNKPCSRPHYPLHLSRQARSSFPRVATRCTVVHGILRLRGPMAVGRIRLTCREAGR